MYYTETKRTMRKWDPSLKTRRTLIWGKPKGTQKCRPHKLWLLRCSGDHQSRSRYTRKRLSHLKSGQIIILYSRSLYRVFVSCYNIFPTRFAVQLPAITSITCILWKAVWLSWREMRREHSLAMEHPTQREYELCVSWGDFRGPGMYWQIESLKPPSGWRWTWYLLVLGLHLTGSVNSFQIHSMKTKGL